MKIYMFRDSGLSYTAVRPYNVFIHAVAEDPETAKAICEASEISSGEELVPVGAFETQAELHRAFPGACMYKANEDTAVPVITLGLSSAERQTVFNALQLYMRRTTDENERTIAQDLSNRCLYIF